MFRKRFFLKSMSLLLIGATFSTSVPIIFAATVAENTVTVIDFEETYLNSTGTDYYAGTTNKSAASWRGSHSEIITEADRNHAMRLTYDNDNNNYKENSAFNLFNSSTNSKFKGEADTTYLISFDYKVECTDNKTVQLYVATCGRSELSDSDLNANSAAMKTENYKFDPATSVITATTEGYVNAVVPYTANGTDYPIILLSVNNSVKDNTHDGTRPYASVLIDNIKISVKADSKILDFEKTYLTSSGANYYANEANRTAANWRGSHSEIIAEADGNHAMRLTYDNQGNNYKENSAFNLFDITSKSKFIGETGKAYVISFDYKVECTDNKTVQLYVVTCGRENLSGSDLNANSAAMQTNNFKFTPATPVITAASESYTRVAIPYTANGTDYPIILLSVNNSVKDNTHDSTRPYASVLIDNVAVEDNLPTEIKCYNYNGNDVMLSVYRYTTFENLEIPSRKGYIFEGWYTDADYTKKAVEKSRTLKDSFM